MGEWQQQRNRAVVYLEPGTTKTAVVELPIAEPGPGEVLVKLHYSDVCHTDAAFCLNSFSTVPPTAQGQIGGHEGAGEVVALGPGVTAPAVGSFVGIKFAADACLTCGTTTASRAAIRRASRTQISGYTVPGTFQRFCTTPARYATPIPSGLDLASAAPLMCGGISVYTALRTAGLRVGDWVVISGAGGGLGHLGVQYAKALGARVVAVDAGVKEALCRELGADDFVDFAAFASDADLAARIKEATGGGARIALMCSASSKSYGQCMSWLGFRGTVACLGIPDKEGALLPSIGDMVTFEHRIIATKTGNRLEAKQCLELAAQGRVKTRYTLRRMESLTNIFEELESGKIQGRVVLDLRGD
ncbi:Alcohol dehydrogenase 2 like protein [Verticillium longisporum]|nr:Alcohol dehydrogenase 2 like protein [Verticillium longisporum]